jgi:hypothetical protein
MKRVPADAPGCHTVPENPSAFSMLGSATLTIVASSITISCAVAMTTSAS